MRGVHWSLSAALLAVLSCQPERSELVSSAGPGVLALSVSAPFLPPVPPTTWRIRIAGNGVEFTLEGNPGQSVSRILEPGTYTISLAGLAQGSVVSFGERSGVVISAGSQTQVSISVASFVPEGVEAPATGIEGQSITISWQPVPGASNGYEVESSPVAAFSQGVVRMPATQSSLTMPAPQAGTYFFRVRAQSNGRTAATGYWSTTTQGTVVQSNNPPRIQLGQTTRSFSAESGGGNPAPQTVSITNGGGGTLSGLACGTVSYGSGQPAGWLNCSVTPGAAPATLTLSPATGSLPAGTYTASVPVTSGIASNSPQSVSVTFTVTSASPPPSIQLSATSRAFSAQAGGASPSSQTVTISNGGGGTLSGLACGTIAYGAGQSGGWLGCSLDSSTAPATLTLSAVTGSLIAGTYTATVPVTSGVAGNSPQNVSVTLTVAAEPVAPFIQLSAVSRTFSATAGGANPAPRTLTVSNGGGGTLSGLGCGPVSYGGGQLSGWLNCSLDSPTAPATLTLSAATGSLPAGSYTATVPVTSGVASNSPQNVSVTFTVSAASPPPAIQLSATSRTFSAQAGGASPSSQTVSISNGGGGTLSGLACGPISYSAGQPDAWLDCSLDSSTAPATMTLSAETGSLLAGTYTASVPVTSGFAGNSPQYVSVTFEVGPPSSSLLTVRKTGMASVTSSPVGISLSVEDSIDVGIFTTGDLVTLTAVPEPMWSMASWGGACEGTLPADPCTVVMAGDRLATLEAVRYQSVLTVNLIGQGRYRVNPIGIERGVSWSWMVPIGYEASIVPLEGFFPGWTFTAWGEDCTGTSIDEVCELVLSENRTALLIFEEAQPASVASEETSSGRSLPGLKRFPASGDSPDLSHEGDRVGPRPESLLENEATLRARFVRSLDSGLVLVGSTEPSHFHWSAGWPRKSELETTGSSGILGLHPRSRELPLQDGESGGCSDREVRSSSLANSRGKLCAEFLRTR